MLSCTQPKSKQVISCFLGIDNVSNIDQMYINIPNIRESRNKRRTQHTRKQMKHVIFCSLIFTTFQNKNQTKGSLNFPGKFFIRVLHHTLNILRPKIK